MGEAAASALAPWLEPLSRMIAPANIQTEPATQLAPALRVAAAADDDRRRKTPARHEPAPARLSPSLPEPPADGILHILRRSPVQLFVWFRLPEDQAGHDLLLRETRASDGSITREFPLGPRATHLYIDAPEEIDPRQLQVGCCREGRFLGYSSVATMPSNAPPPPGKARWREHGDSPRTDSRTPPRLGPLPVIPAAGKAAE
ncbi:MAG: hypothetical protein VCC00_02700 [Deltaproteobacteria bacterium]